MEAKGDLEVDAHHTVEDCGILLGQAFRQALGNKAGINRYADIALPMDETLVRLALDLSGRPFLAFAVTIPQPKIGTFDSELVEEWFRAFAFNAGITLHVDLIRGTGSHHIAEACFKALGRSLRLATSKDEKLGGAIPSSKGCL
uniref:imidazoleglycerol-phosphate dehydratase n=1 Tax=Capitella teleta TaxID=283909 RepID=X2BCX4_CAPTE